MSSVNELKLGWGAAAWGQGRTERGLKLFNTTLSL